MPESKAPTWTREAAMDKAVRHLSLRSHTRRELGAKLRASGMGEERVAQTLETCCRLGYVDDEETACQLAREMLRRGFGPLKIRARLLEKGVDASVADGALASLSQGDAFLEAAERSVQKKLPSLQRETDPAKRRQKLFRFLAQRGFPRSMIMDLVREVS